MSLLRALGRQSLLGGSSSALSLLQGSYRASKLLARWSRHLQTASITAPAPAPAASDVNKPSPNEEGPKELPKAPRPNISVLDTNLFQLSNLIQSGGLNMRPFYQRSLVWDKPRASKLVVTALEGRLIPTIYLEEAEPTADQPNLQYLVLDGKQRLGSLHAFYKGDNSIGELAGPGKNGATEWTGAPTVLKITEESNCNMEWNGVTFKQLTPSQQSDLLHFPIKAVIIGKNTDRDVMLQIFEDLNTGSLNHTMQQSRRAVYWGAYIELLDVLVYLEKFMKLRCCPEPPMADNEFETDREMILRFFAMRRSYKDYKGPLFRFLNKEIHKHRNLNDKDSKEMAAMFKATAETVWDIWGAAACRDTTKRSTRLVPALWDAFMVAVCNELHPPGMKKCGQRQKELRDSADKLKRAYDKLLRDSAFRECLDSSKPAAVVQRIDMFQEMLQRVAPPQPPKKDKRREFTAQQKLEKWQQEVAAGGGTVICPRCNNTIHSIDDAEADHIEPHAHGGRTKLSNMQLLHKWCNRDKGAKLEPQQQETKEPQQQEEKPQQSQPEQQLGNRVVVSASSSAAPRRRRKV